MYSHKSKVISGYENANIYDKVGLNKDNYSIGMWFSHNIETGETSVHCEAIINWLNNPPKRQTLCTGTAAECMAAIELKVTPHKYDMEIDRIREKKANWNAYHFESYQLTTEEQETLDQHESAKRELLISASYDMNGNER